MIASLIEKSLTQVCRELNGATRGAYRVTVRQSADWNEVQVKLYESTMALPIATAYHDRGHTRESRLDCAIQVAASVRSFLYKMPQTEGVTA